MANFYPAIQCFCTNLDPTVFKGSDSPGYYNSVNNMTITNLTNELYTTSFRFYLYANRIDHPTYRRDLQSAVLYLSSVSDDIMLSDQWIRATATVRHYDSDGKIISQRYTYRTFTTTNISNSLSLESISYKTPRRYWSYDEADTDAQNCVPIDLTIFPQKRNLETGKKYAFTLSLHGYYT